jgi:hypothetical protein
LSDIFPGLDNALAQLNQIHTPTSAAIYDQKQIIKANALSFNPFFEKLQMVMSSMEKKKELEPPSGSPRTPTDQQTIAANPNLTHESTGSGGSSQGKPEDPTKLLANELIQRALDVTFEGIGAADYRVMDWVHSPYQLHLTATYLFLIFFTHFGRPQQQMNIKLGNETILPTNDGSVGVNYIKDRKVIMWLNGKFPVLSVEVSKAPPKSGVDSRRNGEFP